MPSHATRAITSGIHDVRGAPGGTQRSIHDPRALHRVSRRGVPSDPTPRLGRAARSAACPGAAQHYVIRSGAPHSSAGNAACCGGEELDPVAAAACRPSQERRCRPPARLTRSTAIAMASPTARRVHASRTTETHQDNIARRHARRSSFLGEAPSLPIASKELQTTPRARSTRITTTSVVVRRKGPNNQCLPIQNVKTLRMLTIAWLGPLALAASLLGDTPLTEQGQARLSVCMRCLRLCGSNPHNFSAAALRRERR